MKILFVCSGNAYRSPVAEALLKKLRPDVMVRSAGINAVIRISEDAKEYLSKENAQKYLKDTSEDLKSKELNDFDLIIAMEAHHKIAILNQCPECRNKIRLWNIEDPYFLPHGSAERIFKQIREKVAELASSI